MVFDRRKADLLAVEIREGIIRAIGSKGSGHVGGSLSIADLLAVLYGGVMNVNPEDPDKKDRDYLVLSKGHAGPALYAALAARGYFPKETLLTLNQNGTILPSHADRCKTPGVDVTTGSLGQGASLAAGLALADKIDGRASRTYLILGDGELNEGQIWEFALFAAHQGLNNLITFIDANGKQLDGSTDEICALGSIEKKFEAFGFHSICVENGADTSEIFKAIQAAHAETQKPCAIVLHTLKGAGVMRYEQMQNCHSVSVSPAEMEEILIELAQKRKEIEGRERI